jgi:hypothetical protein
LNQQKSFNILEKKTPSPISSDSGRKRKTIGLVRAVRRTIKAISRENLGLIEAVYSIIKATEKLVIRNEILEH